MMTQVHTIRARDRKKIVEELRRSMREHTEDPIVWAKVLYRFAGKIPAEIDNLVLTESVAQRRNPMLAELEEALEESLDKLVASASRDGHDRAHIMAALGKALTASR